MMEPIDERSDEWNGHNEEGPAVYTALETLEGVRRTLAHAMSLAELFRVEVRCVRQDADRLRNLLPKLAEHEDELHARGWSQWRIEELIDAVDVDFPRFEALLETFDEVAKEAYLP
jgi:hypothetical protein